MITGKAAIHILYNWLLNRQLGMSKSIQHKLPLLVSPSPFLHASLRPPTVCTPIVSLIYFSGRIFDRLLLAALFGKLMDTLID
jgi:hypothetical protein